MEQPPKVALLIETSNAYSRGLLHGIASYIGEHGPWSIYLTEQRRGESLPAWLGRWQVDGIIARIENASIAKVVRELKKPAVDMSAGRLLPSLPWVETDDLAVARLAAEHLLERGFKHFGFCGDDRYNWSQGRERHFTQLVGDAGYECSVFHPSASAARNSETVIERIGRWIGKLPRPLGVMASYDLQGLQILDACRRQGFQVPDEVAVIGVDNDEVFCELSDPPMSSVILNTQRTGYVAASLLDRMLAGEKIRREAHLIEPLGVAARRSTDVLAIDDQDIVQAVRFIREHACEGISVKSVLNAVPQSRRVLETRFKKLIGRTPHDEIIRVQIQHVKKLLTESDLSLERIAQRAGFNHAEYLSVVFREKEGMPPSRYRVLNRRKRVN
jgi:LacI family transcriptional regulator